MANFAEYINREDAQSNSATREPAVASTVTVYNRDFVGYDGSGRVTSAGIATLPLIGMVMGGASRATGRSQRTSPTGSQLSATGNVAGTVKVLVNIESEAEYLLKANATLRAQDVGKTYNLTGAAGSQLINGTITTDAIPAGGTQFELVRLANGMRGTDGTYGVFRLKK